ncbi:MAG: RHS repeat-associated core domain-containing protein, partial [Verrucomicrobia bacterium]|nr:RHS repeat-associated core domain-containing protein [Verrucomicrobiota bacterium]
MSSTTWWRVLGFGLFLFGLAPLAHAQGDTRKAVVAVKLDVTMTGYNYKLDVVDEYGGTNWGDSITSYSGSQEVKTMRVVPGKVYSFYLSWPATNGPGGFGEFESDGGFGARITAPPGYTVLVRAHGDNMPWIQSTGVGGTVSTTSSNGADSFQIVEDSVYSTAQAGRMTRLSVADLVMEWGLGTLDNGRSAGRIQMRSDGRVGTGYGLSTTSSAFYIGSLQFLLPGETGLQWTSITNGQKIETGQVRAEAVQLTLGQPDYTLSFYAANATGGGYSSTPFVSYLVERITSGLPSTAPSGADCLRVTETHYGTTNRTLLHYVFRSTSSDRWTLIEGDDNSEQRIEDHASSVSGSTRTETVLVKKNVSGSATTVAKSVWTWTTATDGIERLTQTDVWTDLSTGDHLATQYAYNSDGQLSQVTAPDGGVKSYTYYPYSDLYRGRKPYTTTVPWSDGTTVKDQVMTYDYTGPSYASTWEYPKTIETAINGTVVGRTVNSYAFDSSFTSGSSPEGRLLVGVTSKSYSSDTVSVVTTSKTYGKENGDYLYAGRPFMVKYPDGRQQSFRYQRGTYTSSTGFVADTSSTTTPGKAWRTWIVDGSWCTTSAAPTTAPPAPDVIAVSSLQTITAADGLAFEPITLVGNQSTLTEVIRNSDDTIVSQKTYVYDGATAAFDTAKPVSVTTNTWLDAVRQTSTTALNGVTSTWNWDNGLFLHDATDGTGIKQTYTYDSLGRVHTVTKAGVSADTVNLYDGQADQVITYTYDVQSHLVAEKHSAGSLERTTAHEYDASGRLTKTTTPNGLITKLAYSLVSGGGAKVEQTNPDNGKVTTYTLTDGKTLQVLDPYNVPTNYSYSLDTSTHQITSRISVGSAGSRWQQTTVDWLGRTIESRQPAYNGLSDNVTAAEYYVSGLLKKTTRTGLADEWRTYDNLGHVILSGLDVGGSGLSETDPLDRITGSNGSPFAKIDGEWWVDSMQYTYPYASGDGSGKGVGDIFPLGETLNRLTGWSSGQIAETRQLDHFNHQSTSVTILDASAKRVTTTLTSDGVTGSAVSVVINGLAVKVTGADGRSAATEYDDLGRMVTAHDSRTGDTTYTYFDSPGQDTDRVNTVTAPGAAVTTYAHYDSGGRPDRISITHDDITAYTYYEYDMKGRLKFQWGGAALPVSFTYTEFDQIENQCTYRGGLLSDWSNEAWPSAQTGDTTHFTYDDATGLLKEKKDALNRTVNYTYNQQGQILTRQWARYVPGSSSERVTATYDYYDLTAEPKSITYNDGTPTVSYEYYARGQLKSTTDVPGLSGRETRTLQYNADMQPASEQLPAYLGSRLLTYTYETSGSGLLLGRPSGYQVGVSGAPTSDQTTLYGYDALGRTGHADFTHADVSTRSFNYSYQSSTSLLAGVSLGTPGTDYTVVRHYDEDRDALKELTTKFGSTVKASYTYTYNQLGQRLTALQSGVSGTAFADLGDTYYRYGYNTRGELESATGYLGSTVTATTEKLPGRTYQFTYDAAGNRASVNNTGNSTNTAYYGDTHTGGTAAAANSLNQIEKRENNYVTVSGTSDTAANILVNGIVADRKGPYWSSGAFFDNEHDPAYGDINLIAGKASGNQKQTASLSKVFIAQASEELKYDADGNLIEDGRWKYTWDAENRLISMETNFGTGTADSPALHSAGAAGVIAGVAHRRLDFTYDSVGRRLSKRTYTWSPGSPGSWVPDPGTERRFIYEGWNLVVELQPVDASTFTRVRTYAWGLDIAGTMGATGGIGALLQFVDHTGSTAAIYLPAYDGSGNVAALMKSDGSIHAAYEYSPFGELLRKEGDYAASNPLRSATKYTDNETGLVYYGHRYYSPSLGRFINRDPSGEAGGMNLYAFCLNDNINSYDVLGLDPAADERARLDLEAWWMENKPDNVGISNYSDVDRVNAQPYITGVSVNFANNGTDSMAAGSTGAAQAAAYDRYLSRVTAAIMQVKGVSEDVASALAEGVADRIAQNSVASQSTANATGNKAITGGSKLGNWLQGHIPLVGGMLGRAADVAAGAVNVALGLASFGRLGSGIGTGLQEIGGGVAGLFQIVASDTAAALVGVTGYVYTKVIDVANVVSFGHVASGGNVLAALGRMAQDIIPDYGMFGGPNWGVTQKRDERDIMNYIDKNSYKHDQHLGNTRWASTTWVRDQWTPVPDDEIAPGLFGIFYALLGT